MRWLRLVSPPPRGHTEHGRSRNSGMSWIRAWTSTTSRRLPLWPVGRQSKKPGRWLRSPAISLIVERAVESPLAGLDAHLEGEERILVGAQRNPVLQVVRFLKDDRISRPARHSAEQCLGRNIL